MINGKTSSEKITFKCKYLSNCVTTALFAIFLTTNNEKLAAHRDVPPRQSIMMHHD